jgi:two-component system, OmpR family, phosphate regulon sensor histidine kinase PhoR
MTDPLGPLDHRAFDALETAVLLFDTDAVLGLNKAAETLFGLSTARARERSLIEVLRNHRLERLAFSGGQLELELQGRLFRVRAEPGVMLFDDISAIRKREFELREVMAVLSHEFRTPVAAIKSLLEALETDPPLPERQRFLEMSLLEAERLVRLVEDLTVGFRPQAERTFVALEAFERVQRLTLEEFQRREVRLEADLNDAVVRCDPDKLVQVLLNLLENAARHGPNPGLIWIEATRVTGFNSFTIFDQGQPLDDYTQIFDAHRRSPTSRGSGMGLYIVRSIVQAWNGEVKGHYNPKRQGNEFIFTVPAA